MAKQNKVQARFMTNASRLEKLRLETDPIITNIVQGVSNESYVSNLLLPEVPVAKRTGRYPIFGNEALQMHDTKRALRDDDIKQMPSGVYEFGKFDCNPHALGFKLDIEEIEAATDVVNLEQYYSQIVMDALLLGMEAERCEILQDSDNYAVNNSDVLSGDDCWDAAKSLPLTQINDAILTVRGTNVRKPNTLVLSPAAFFALREHSTLIEKIKYSQKAVVTEDLIASIISTTDNPITVVVGTGMYYDPVEEKYISLWNNSAVLAYVTQTPRAQRNKWESTFGYTFVRSGYPYGGREAGDFGVTTNIGVFHSYDIKILKNSAAFLWTSVAGTPKG